MFIHFQPNYLLGTFLYRSSRYWVLFVPILVIVEICFKKLAVAKNNKTTQCC